MKGERFGCVLPTCLVLLAFGVGCDRGEAVSAPTNTATSSPEPIAARQFDPDGNGYVESRFDGVGRLHARYRYRRFAPDRPFLLDGLAELWERGTTYTYTYSAGELHGPWSVGSWFGIESRGVYDRGKLIAGDPAIHPVH